MTVRLNRCYISDSTSCTIVENTCHIIKSVVKTNSAVKIWGNVGRRSVCKVGEVRGAGRKAKAPRPPLGTTPIKKGPPSPFFSSPPLSGFVFQGPTSSQDVWCGSLDAGFLCTGRGLTAK